ncbi:uncharacterized ABC transporter permease component YrbE [Vibrio astriarenae]|nr:uncharacterized ABC transporter permease component YrbE [Vibrio sp. C7]
MHLVQTLGRSMLMLLQVLFAKPQFMKSFPLVVKQCYALGVQSLAIIVVSGAFIGMVLSFRAT